jgi:hypothetical protein
MFCEGGLFGCVKCGSFEGATTTHCPGYSIYDEKGNDIYAGKIDYRDGEWVEVGSPHTPNRGWSLYWNPTKELHYHGSTECTSEFCTFDPKTKLFQSRQTEYDE